ncbi:probable sodium-coupled neutral amino acid transporter 6 isoform X1, partial [Tachysurus ichikawai]
MTRDTENVTVQSKGGYQPVGEEEEEKETTALLGQ